MREGFGVIIEFEVLPWGEDRDFFRAFVRVGGKADKKKGEVFIAYAPVKRYMASKGFKSGKRVGVFSSLVEKGENKVVHLRGFFPYGGPFNPKEHGVLAHPALTAAINAAISLRLKKTFPGFGFRHSPGSRSTEMRDFLERQGIDPAKEYSVEELHRKNRVYAKKTAKSFPLSKPFRRR